ncbi:hypothetical protein TVAG_473990 [Trichomonas vaginalis G3]|uniref:Glycosyltransferase 61 catalytic domain-containing protein n=1 Tax=Trichomonas vaginalis (strain ATCC PRA-98 / G3) TaxID=412133 RepID=A2EQ45_TRIV3|nr:glycosyltransferase family [Trichomonas vaginalis G3]EAY05220.1 hypothetical protein TVAG_473990 [Trichomonas vaginalis G3]KAI5542613.1 glycosyltransferase family [Trichomonas vaginalis G3]|eukprot:XP_001317443.1 hypothetical protein [Trichomonas vaginalis G3]
MMNNPSITFFNTTLRRSSRIPSKHIVKLVKIRENFPVNPNNLIIDKLTPHKYPSGDKLKFQTHDKVVNYAQKLSTSYAILQNLYINSWSLFSNGEHVYVMEGYRAFRYIYTQYNHTLIGKYDSVIAIGDRYAEEYGHFFVDVLAPLMCIPREVWPHSHIVVKENLSYCTDLLNALNFTNDRIIHLKDGEWIFAKTIHTTLYPSSYFRHPATAHANLSILLKQAYGVEHAKPTRYVLMNRDKSLKRRRLANLDEVKEIVQKLYPTIVWEDLSDFYPTIKAAARSFSTIKLLFGITGSNLVRAVFMQPKSVLVIAQLNFNDYNMMAISLVNDLMYFAFSTKGYGHYTEKPVYLVIDDALRAIKIGIYAAQNGEFPKNSTEYHYIP